MGVPLMPWLSSSTRALALPPWYLGLGLLHSVLRGQQFLVDLLQAGSTDLSGRKCTLCKS